MTAETEFHTFTVDDLDIDEAVSSGDTVEFTVTFDKAGEFHLFCIPHEALGMEGTIKVQ
jgi:plastocyanin